MNILEAKIATKGTRKVYDLPHGFTIVQNKYLDKYWSLFYRGNFVFQGSESQCYIELSKMS